MSKVGFGSGSGVTLSGSGRVRVLDLGSPSGFGFFRVLKNDYNLPKIYTFKAIFSLQKYSVLKNRPILIVFHAGKVEKRNEEKFWGKFLRIFVHFDEILPKFWFLIVFGCQKSGSGRVRVSSPRVRVGFGCPKMSGYPSGIRVFGSPDTSLIPQKSYKTAVVIELVFWCFCLKIILCLYQLDHEVFSNTHQIPNSI